MGFWRLQTSSCLSRGSKRSNVPFAERGARDLLIISGDHSRWRVGGKGGKGELVTMLALLFVFEQT